MSNLNFPSNLIAYILSYLPIEQIEILELPSKLKHDVYKLKTQIITTPSITQYFIDGKLHRLDGPAEEHADVYYCDNFTRKGNKLWYVNGLLHNLSGPAIIAPRCVAWYVNGLLHRTDGPAYTNNIDEYHWYVNGLRHRLDGPAVVSEYEEIWYVNGLLHNLSGPAEIKSAYTAWYVNGLLHNLSGPAIIYNNGECEYWINDVKVEPF